jgi:hypothetical protein
VDYTVPDALGRADRRTNPPQRPPLGCEPKRYRPPAEDCPDSSVLGSSESCRTSGRLPRTQPAEPSLLDLLGPFADRGLADTQAAGDGGVAQSTAL